VFDRNSQVFELVEGVTDDVIGCFNLVPDIFEVFFVRTFLDQGHRSEDLVIGVGESVGSTFEFVPRGKISKEEREKFELHEEVSVDECPRERDGSVGVRDGVDFRFAGESDLAEYPGKKSELARLSCFCSPQAKPTDSGTMTSARLSSAPLMTQGFNFVP